MKIRICLLSYYKIDRDVQFKTSMDYQNYINDSNSFNPVCFGKIIWKKNIKDNSQ